MDVNYFLTLFFSAILFFGGYGLFLLARKEQLVIEIKDVVVEKKFTDKEEYFQSELKGNTIFVFAYKRMSN